MDPTAEGYERLISRFVDWASGEEHIRTALVLGSRARADHPADEWADLDVAVISKDPQRLLATAGWLAQVGVPLLTFTEPAAVGGDQERRVLFEGGLDVDFAVLPYEKVALLLEAAAQGQPEAALFLKDSLGRGMRVLLDKDGQVGTLSGLLAQVETQPAPGPSEAIFLQAVNDFWYHAVWTAKHLRRGELWWAKSCCDDYLKALLRQMLEWHARATKGPDYDTWFRGRFLEQWADPRALQQLGKTFAHYDEEDTWRALLATIELYRWVSGEAAESLGYRYATTGERYATELVLKLYSGRG